MIRRLRRFSQQVLGINRRNHDLLARYNPRALFQIVDNKVKTKEALTALGVPVVETLATYHYQHELQRFADDTRDWREFVVKPAQGSGGGGVLIMTDRQGEMFETAGGRQLSTRQLESHLSDILGGVFSLNQRYDDALVERRVHAHPSLTNLSYQGLPDLRILVFRGIPLLAMLRLATKASRGRANLHVGGIGVGIDLISGRTTAAIAGKHPIAAHPDHACSLLGVQIPEWEEMLRIAARCADAVALGYLGIDIVLDAQRGPLVLELNARPGLAIQLANRRGLRPLITAVERLARTELSVTERVRLGREIIQL